MAKADYRYIGDYARELPPGSPATEPGGFIELDSASDETKELLEAGLLLHLTKSASTSAKHTDKDTDTDLDGGTN